MLASRQTKVEFALGSSCQIKVKESAPKKDQKRMAAPGFMFTFSSEMNPQVNCLLYAKSIVNCKPSALLACKPKQKLNAFAPSHALHLLSPPCPQCSQRVLQLTRHLACIYAGLLCHINLTTRAPQRHLITQPTLTTTSLRYIPVEGRSLSISDQAFW